MLVCVAVTDIQEVDGVPYSIVREPADDEGNSHWVTINKVETFAMGDDGLHLIYQDEDDGEATLESAVSVSMGSEEEYPSDDEE